MQGLKDQPQLYIHEIFELLNIIHLKNGLLANDDVFQYTTRKLIGVTFEYFSEKEKTFLFQLINNLKVEEDSLYLFKYGREHHETLRQIRNNLGYRQYLFLNSIPYNQFRNCDKTRKQFYELRRKFGKILDNKPPDDYHGMAGIVGAPLGGNAYDNMSLDAWINSMIKYNEHYRGDWSSFKGGLREHANAFQIKVQQNPERYYNFIFHLHQINEVSKKYLLYGLQGLIAAEYDVAKTKKLFSLLMEICLSQDISFVHSLVYTTGYFIKSKEIDESLIKFLHSVSTQTLQFEMGTDEKYINSLRNLGIDYLMQCSEAKEYEDIIFQAVELAVAENVENLNEGIVRHLAMLNHLNISRAFVIFKTIVDTNNISILKTSLWSAHYFNNAYHSEMGFYFEKIIQNQEIHKDGKYIMVGSWLNETINDKNWYDRFVESSFEAKVGALKVAEKNLFTEDGKINNRTMAILFQFLDVEDQGIERGESFSSAYSGIVLRQFKDEKLFPQVLPFLIQYSKSSHCFREPTYLLSYLTKCAKIYSVECLELLRNIDFTNAPNIAHHGYYRQEPIQLILAIYSMLSKKSSQNKEHLKETLDLFDSLLQHPHLRKEANIAIEEILN